MRYLTLNFICEALRHLNCQLMVEGFTEFGNQYLYIFLGYLEKGPGSAVVSEPSRWVGIETTKMRSQRMMV